MHTTSILFLFLLSSLLLGCSEQQDEEKTEGHVWQHQVDTINDAKALREQVNKDSQQRQKTLDKVTQE